MALWAFLALVEATMWACGTILIGYHNLAQVQA